MSNLSGEQIYDWLLTQEESEDDDHRFYASYLIGHVSLTIADAEEQNADFHQLLELSLAKALKEDSLTESDIEGINSMLKSALTQ